MEPVASPATELACPPPSVNTYQQSSRSCPAEPRHVGQAFVLEPGLLFFSPPRCCPSAQPACQPTNQLQVTQTGEGGGDLLESQRDFNRQNKPARNKSSTHALFDIHRARGLTEVEGW